MRYAVLIIMALLASSCTKEVLKEAPFGSFMPGYLNIDSIQPITINDTATAVKPGTVDFVSIPLDSGVLTNSDGKQKIPLGVLISPRKAVLYNFYRGSWEEQQKELLYAKYLMKEYYDKSKSAEILYQNEILRWRKEAQRNWWEKNMGYLGFGVGALTVIAIDFAIYQVAK